MRRGVFSDSLSKFKKSLEIPDVIVFKVALELSQESDTKDTCPICLSPNVPIVKKICGHDMHL